MRYESEITDSTLAVGGYTGHINEKPGVYRVRLTVTEYDSSIGVINELEVTVTSAKGKVVWAVVRLDLDDPGQRGCRALGGWVGADQTVGLMDQKRLWS